MGYLDRVLLLLYLMQVVTVVSNVYPSVVHAV